MGSTGVTPWLNRASSTSAASNGAVSVWCSRAANSLNRYSVETDVEALDQIQAQPAQALPFYAELIALLELAPWSGDPYNQQRPEASMRAHTFGPTPKAWRST